MAENNWSLLDGRSILVEFDAAQAEGTWALNDGRSFDVAFDAPPSPWSEWDWLRSGGMIQAADGGGGSVNATAPSLISTYAYSASVSTPTISHNANAPSVFAGYTYSSPVVIPAIRQDRIVPSIAASITFLAPSVTPSVV